MERDFFGNKRNNCKYSAVEQQGQQPEPQGNRGANPNGKYHGKFCRRLNVGCTLNSLCLCHTELNLSLTSSSPSPNPVVSLAHLLLPLNYMCVCMNETERKRESWISALYWWQCSLKYLYELIHLDIMEMLNSMGEKQPFGILHVAEKQSFITHFWVLSSRKGSEPPQYCL